MYCRAPNNSRRQLKMVMTGGLGDQLLATPFVRYFAKSGQYDRIECAVINEATEIFDKNPYIDRLIPCQSSDLLLWALPEKDCDVFSPYIQVAGPNKGSGDMSVTVKHLLRSKCREKPIIRQVAEHHHLNMVDDNMEIFTSSEDEKWADNFVRQFGSGPVILLHPFSQLPEKDLPRTVAEKIVMLLQQICVVLQFPTGKPLIRGTISFQALPSIRKTAALFRRLGTIVTVDSLPGHLACTVQTPAVVLFGPSNPAIFGHRTNRNLRPSDCPPCAGTPRRVSCRRSLCMEAIDPDLAVEAV